MTRKKKLPRKYWPKPGLKNVRTGVRTSVRIASVLVE